VAVASAGLCASLHLAPGRLPRQHPTAQFFTRRMPFLPPNQQRQSTEGKQLQTIGKIIEFKFLTNNTHTHPFNGPMSGTTWMSRYQKGQTNPNFTEERDSEWQWHQLDHMQVCTLLQTDNHNQHPTTEFLKARCASCCPTNSVKASKANTVCVIK